MGKKHWQLCPTLILIWCSWMCGCHSWMAWKQPRLSGLGVVGAQKKDIPIIAFTAHTMEGGRLFGSGYEGLCVQTSHDQ